MSSRISQLGRILRQRRHHRAFRIAPPLWDESAHTQLEQLLADVVEPAAQSNSPTDEKALAEAATNLWRAQARLIRDDDRKSDIARQTGRYLRTSQQALERSGLIIQGHNGAPFRPGQLLEALAFHPDGSLTVETVLDTVRPSIYLHDRCIQMGQVIVGSPVATQPERTPRAQMRTDHA